LKRLLLIVSILLLVFVSRAIADNNGLEKVMDSINEIIYSCESGISLQKLQDLNQKMYIEIKKYQDKYPNDRKNDVLNEFVKCSRSLSVEIQIHNGVSGITEEGQRRIFNEFSLKIPGLKEQLKNDKKVEKVEDRKHQENNLTNKINLKPKSLKGKMILEKLNKNDQGYKF